MVRVLNKCTPFNVLPAPRLRPANAFSVSERSVTTFAVRESCCTLTSFTRANDLQAEPGFVFQCSIEFKVPLCVGRLSIRPQTTLREGSELVGKSPRRIKSVTRITDSICKTHLSCFVP